MCSSIDFPIGTDRHEHLFHQPAQARHGHPKGFGSSAGMERARLLRFSLLSLLAGMLLAVPLAWFGVQQIDGILHYSPMAMWGVFGVAFLLVALISLGSVCLISWGAVRENPVNHIKTE